MKERIAKIDKDRPFESFRVAPALVDSFYRQHDYLRISLTEKCNLRCFYCMPEEGVELSPKEHILTDDEVIRLATLFVKSGVTKIRLTGGEPTVRKGMIDLMGRINELRQYGLRSIAMTTNGIGLHRRLPNMIKNGLTHINISLDTMDPYQFEIMTRRPGHESVLKTIEVALNSPELKSVKVNVVVMKGLNDREVPDFVAWAKDKDVSVRFIEFMPFSGNKWSKNKMVPSSELLERVRERFPTIDKAPPELNETARSWQIPGHKGSLGFISSMSDHFCATCNRLRLTADGQIKVCLFDAKEVSLRDIMRNGGTDEDLLKIIGVAVQGKHAKHGGIENVENIDVITNRPMILIGGRWHPRAPKSRAVGMFSSRPSDLRRPVNTVLLRHNSTRANSLTHLDHTGRASMVDISEKTPTTRTATATGRIYIPPIAYQLVTSTYPSEDDSSSSTTSPDFIKARRKGDALTVAQLAAIMASKRTSDLIPLCHPLMLNKVAVTLAPEAPPPLSRDEERHYITCSATVTTEGKTGVEMEALTAVSVGLLTVWDMLKAVAGKEMEIGEIKVVQKSGGRSGDFTRDA